MAPPPLPPLSCVAGSLALSFTGAAQPTARPTDAPLSLEVPEPPPPATPPVTSAPPQPAPDPLDVPPPPSVTYFGSPAPAPVVSTPRSPLLRPSEKRFFFSLFVGGSKALLGGASSPYSSGMDFKLEGAIGGHGKNRRSLAGAAVVQVRTGFPFSSFTLAPRLQWDKQILPDYAIYLTTSVTFGYRLTTYGAYGLIGLLEGAYHGGMAAVGWGVSAIVADRLLLSFRPVNPEIEVTGGTGFSINWDVFGGLGVVW